MVPALAILSMLAETLSICTIARPTCTQQAILPWFACAVVWGRQAVVPRGRGLPQHSPRLLSSKELFLLLPLLLFLCELLPSALYQAGNSKFGS